MRTIITTTDGRTDVASTLSPQQRVVQAIRNSQLPETAKYFEAVLSTRLGCSFDRAGSYFDRPDEKSLLEELLAADWRPYSHPAIKEPAVAFAAPTHGAYNGMVELASLDPDMLVVLIDPKGGAAHWDGKQKVSASISEATGLKPSPEDFMVILLGPSGQGPDAVEIVWTLHPGAPLPPSVVDRCPGGGAADRHNLSVSVRQALELGLTHAKLTPSSL